MTIRHLDKTVQDGCQSVGKAQMVPSQWSMSEAGLGSRPKEFLGICSDLLPYPAPFLANLPPFLADAFHLPLVSYTLTRLRRLCQGRKSASMKTHLTVIGLAVPLSSIGSPNTWADEPERVPNEVLVKYEDGVGEEKLISP